MLGVAGTGLQYVTRGNMYAVQPSPQNVTNWGLPLASAMPPPLPPGASMRSSADASMHAAAGVDISRSSCQANVLLSDNIQLELTGGAFHRSGCLSGRFGITLGAPHVVQGYTCPSYTVPTMLFESDDDKLWLSTPIDDGQTSWNTAVPTGIPSLPNASFSTMTVAALNQSSTPTMVVVLNPKEGNQILLAVAGKGFADLSVLVEVEGPDSPL